MAFQHGYLGTTGTTRKERRAYACPCGERFSVEVWRAIDVRSDPELGREFLAGELNRACCPACGEEHLVQVSVVYHDPIAERMVLVLPDGLRHRELEERARLYLQLADDGAPPLAYVRSFEAVFGVAGLAALIEPNESREGTAVTAIPSDSIPESLPAEVTPVGSALGEGTDASQDMAIDAGDADASDDISIEHVREPVEPRPADAELEDSTGRTHLRLPLVDTRQGTIERWIANREQASAFHVEDSVIVCATLKAIDLEPFAVSPLELRLQLHRLPNYPLVAITILGPEKNGNQPAVHALLDIARAAHRLVLEALERRAALTLHVFDAVYTPVIERWLTAPLEQNAFRLAAEAKSALSLISPAARSFERAKLTFTSDGYDRLGRIQVALSDVELGRLDSPCALRQAVANVHRWSEAGAEAYLLEIQSFPLEQWQKIRNDVVRAAIAQGIHVPRVLTQRAFAAGEADWPMVLREQLGAFREVASRRQPNDLSPAEEAENWRLLFAECRTAGVNVEPELERLAERALQRVGAVEDATDLRSIETGDLIRLLDRKELRREAALALCERQDTTALPALFGALRKMTRAEANRVLPALASFGDGAVRFLIEGLRARKSFVRQGCALALGTIGAAAAADPLARLLIDEPTDIWPEVARALGELGAAAVMPLAVRLRDTDGDGRERIARALAYQLVLGVRSPVEMLAAGQDPASSETATHAFELEAEVREEEGEVRGGRVPGDETVVRMFTRRFFEALGGAVELQEDDLEEVDDEGSGSAEGGRSAGDDERLEERVTPRPQLVSGGAASRLPREPLP